MESVEDEELKEGDRLDEEEDVTAERGDVTADGDGDEPEKVFVSLARDASPSPPPEGKGIQVEEEVEELTYSLAASNPFGNADDDEDDLFGGRQQQQQEEQATGSVAAAFGVTEKLARGTEADGGASYFDGYEGGNANAGRVEPTGQVKNDLQAHHKSEYLHAEDEVAVFNPQVQQTYQEVQTPPTYGGDAASGPFGATQGTSEADFFDNYGSGSQTAQDQTPVAEYQAGGGQEQQGYGGAESGYQSYAHSHQQSQGSDLSNNFDYSTTSPYGYAEQQQQQPEAYRQEAYDYSQQQQPEVYQPPVPQQQQQPQQQPELYQPQQQQQQFYQEGGMYNNNNNAYSTGADYGGGYNSYSNVDQSQTYGQPQTYDQPQTYGQPQQPAMMMPVPLGASSSSSAPPNQAAPTLMVPQANSHEASASSQPATSSGWDSYSNYNGQNGQNPAPMVPSEMQYQNAPDQMYQPGPPSGMQQQHYTSFQPSQPASGGGSGSGTHGRPACAMAAFGFGGRLCLYSPQLQQIKVVGMGEYIQESCPAGVQSRFSDERDLMDAFSGPLSSMRQGQVKSTLLKFFSEKYKGSGNASELTCTKVLNVLVQHCEKLSKLPHPDLCKQIAEILLSEEGNGAQNGAAAPGSDYYNSNLGESPLKTGFQQLDSAEAAGQMQSLLCQGKSLEALQVAIQGQVWGPALVLAQTMGKEKYCEIVSAMTNTCLVKDSPLERLINSVAESSGPARNASSSSLNSLSGQGDSNHQRSSSGFFGGDSGSGFGFLNSAGKDKNATPAEASPSPYSSYAEGASSPLSSWKKALCILANNRKEWKNLGIKQLGDDLVSSDTFAAHLCYILGCYELEPYTETSKLCLVGLDTMRFRSLHTKFILLTEVYEWLITQQNNQYVSYAFQPYKLLYATKLLELGNLNGGAKYIQAVLGKLGTGKLTPELTLCKYTAETLMERLHNSGGNIGNIGNIGNKILGWLDRGITSLVMGDTNSNEGTPRMFQVPQGQQQQQQQQYHQAPPQEPAGQPSAQAPAKPSQEQANGEKKQASATKASSHARTGSGGNLFRGALSSFGNLIRSSVSDPSKEAKLGQEENTFFFDEDLKVWREKGKDPPKAGGALPPPPTSASFAPAAPAADDAKPEASVPTGGPPPPAAPAAPRDRRSVRSRYVDTFNTGASSGGGSSSSAAPSKPLVPGFGASATMFKPPSDGSSPSVFMPPAPAVGEESSATETQEAAAPDSGASPAMFMPAAVDASDGGAATDPAPLMPEPMPMAFGSNPSDDKPPGEVPPTDPAQDAGQAPPTSSWDFPQQGNDDDEYQDISF
ncbi:Sec16/Sec31-like coatomer protein [Chloropicon primus]|uniref:Sec16/Sec31-like coatomer protein n=1 Tax=Chloropicon primus TaxID=1764295 RepID=A0A5B8MVT0_9CHLO|nr:Sec16/Sec31-like coatomer protein [Chloropicon primus]|eukprot:QDZ24908.1 Sec16/Sec31-like coatomer protein [Chloropicon primus]